MINAQVWLIICIRFQPRSLFGFTDIDSTLVDDNNDYRLLSVMTVVLRLRLDEAETSPVT